MKRLSVVSVPLMPLYVLLEGSKKFSVRGISVFSQIQPLISIAEYESIFFFFFLQELQSLRGNFKINQAAEGSVLVPSVVSTFSLLSYHHIFHFHKLRYIDVSSCTSIIIASEKVHAMWKPRS